MRILIGILNAIIRFHFASNFMAKVENRYVKDDSLIDLSKIPSDITHLSIIDCPNIRDLNSLSRLTNL